MTLAVDDRQVKERRRVKSERERKASVAPRRPPPPA